MEKYSDSVILEGLRSYNSKTIKYLYRRYLPMVRYMIEKEGDSGDLADDIFQEAMYALLVLIRNKDFELRSSFRSYFFAICNNQWKMHLRRKKTERNYQRLKLDEDKESDFTEFLDQPYAETVFWEVFENLDKACKTIIKLIFRELSLKEISDIMGMSYGYIRRKKCECTSDLYSGIRSHPDLKDRLQCENVII